MCYEYITKIEIKFDKKRLSTESLSNIYKSLFFKKVSNYRVGGGYALGTPADTGYHHGFELWHWFGKYNPNIAMSFSIRLGVCF